MYMIVYGNEVSEELVVSSSANYPKIRNLSVDDKKPSHIELCEYILASNENDSDNNNNNVVVSETKEFCTNDKEFQQNVLQIFTSAALSASAGDHVSYRHDCAQYYEESDVKTLFMKLPEIVMEEVKFQPEELSQLCSKFVHNNNNNENDGYYNSVYEIINDPKWSVAMVNNIVRHIRVAYETLFHHKPQYDDTGEQQRRQLTLTSWFGREDEPSSTYEIQIGSNQFVHRKLLANSNSDAPSHDKLDETIIFLDDSKTLPFSSYDALIPRSATNVYIFVPPSIQEMGTKLLSYLQELSPRAKVEIQEVSSMKEEILQRLISVQTLICLTESCSFPATSRIQTTVMVLNSDIPWMNNLVLNAEFISKHGQILWLPESTIDPVEQIDSAETPQAIRSPLFCPHIRGRHGIWEQDLNLASKLQYKKPLDHYFGFADSRFHPTHGIPFRSPTTFFWRDTTCPVNIYNGDSFCELLSNHQDLSRIMFVGDFVSMNQAYSLWKILGHEDSPKPMIDSEPNWEREIICPNNNQKILLQFVRNDKLIENDDPVNLPQKVANCDAVYCYKWTEKYRQFNENNPDSRSIVIFNFGAHFYSDNEYEDRMTSFLQTLGDVAKDRFGRDLLFFRTTTPGHDLCNRQTSNLPLQNFEEYRSTMTWKYSWDLHDGFNDIADRKIRLFNQDLTGTPSLTGVQPINFLDIYPMTVLRRDGHVGGKDCHKCLVSNDCFYYSLPGPSDWWNHLLLSNVRDYLYHIQERIYSDKQQSGTQHQDLTALLGPQVVIE